MALFFRPASIYHPQRRAILHLKHLKQEKHKFKQRLPNHHEKKDRNSNILKNAYKLSDHFRQQSLEIAALATTKKEISKPRTGSLLSSVGVNSNEDNPNSHSSAHSNTNSLDKTTTGSINHKISDKNSYKNAKGTNLTTPSINSSISSSSRLANGDHSIKDGQLKSNICKSNENDQTKANKQIDEERGRKKFFSSFNGRQSSSSSESKKIFKNQLTSYFDLREHLNKLTKLIRSTSLNEYFDLLRSRNLKFIIIFSFICSFTKIYLVIVSVFILIV